MVFWFWCNGPAALALPAVVVPGVATGATIFLSFTDKPIRGTLFAVAAAIAGILLAAFIDVVVGIASCGLGFE